MLIRLVFLLDFDMTLYYKASYKNYRQNGLFYRKTISLRGEGRG